MTDEEAIIVEAANNAISSMVSVLTASLVADHPIDVVVTAHRTLAGFETFTHETVTLAFPLAVALHRLAHYRLAEINSPDPGAGWDIAELLGEP